MRHKVKVGTVRHWCVILAALAFGLLFQSRANALTLTVTGSDGTPITNFRWVIEEDNTHPVRLGVSDPFSLGVGIPKSYAPVVASGDETSMGPITGLDVSTKRHVISVLPDSGYSMGSAQIAVGQTAATIIVNPFAVPLAQMRVMVFEDTVAISGAAELPAERGLANFEIEVFEAGGAQAFDAFGNTLGTTYLQNPDGSFQMDLEGNPIVDVPGEMILTNSEGIAVIKNLPPGPYSITAAPRDGQPWIQTTAIGGGPLVPVTIRAGEPEIFAQGGLFNMHAMIGFLRPFRMLPLGTGTISGRCVLEHSAHPPQALKFPGNPIKDCYVGLNSVEMGVEVGVLAQPADPVDGTFSITGIPAGTWQLVTWDRPLNHLMNIRTIEVTPGGTVLIGDVTMPRWVSAVQGYVFYDSNENGVMEVGEGGIPFQAVNLRNPDGTILQATGTDLEGAYSMPGVAPAGSWTVLEVDFAGHKTTGATFAADQGGALLPGAVSNPQPPRTELGTILVEGLISHTDQVNLADWGKVDYGPGPDLVFDTPDDENGGISGIVYYATTRAEDDPRLAVGEEWEPGIPRVQVNLYADSDVDGLIDDMDGLGDGSGSSVTLADVDNFPFQWTGGGSPGPEDIDRNYPTQTPGVFDAGDAVQIAWTDSFDDNLPTACVRSCSASLGACLADSDCPGGEVCTVQVVNARRCSVSPIACTSNGDCPGAETCNAAADVPIIDCAETLQTWSQMRPAVFDGGYAFETWFPGGVDSGSSEEPLPTGVYITEAVAPAGYEHAKEEDRNVDFGDVFTPTPALLPVPCVGTVRTVPDFMSMDGTTPAPFFGEPRPLCDRKQVILGSGQNAVSDFFLFTPVPKAGRIIGDMANLFAPQMNPANPNFGGFLNPSWLPVSVQDYLGNEVARVYGDEYGRFSVLVGSTWSVHVPQPSGVSPAVYKVCPNHPGPIDDGFGGLIPDPNFDPQYDQPCYNVEVFPGKTTRVLAPVNAIAAVNASATPSDCELPHGTPVIDEVNGPVPPGGPFLPTCVGGELLTITSPGTVPVPDWTSTTGGTVLRDFGFGPLLPGSDATVGGISLGITLWTPTSITAAVPPAVCAALASGAQQLLVTRGDNGMTSLVGVSVHTIGPVTYVAGPPAPGSPPPGPIQLAIDAAVPDELILIPPGTYQENLIISQPVRLQGYGAYSTIIDAGNFAVNTADWEARRDGLISGGAVDLIPGQRTNFAQESGAGITVLGKATGPTAFTALSRARIDGLTISGAIYAGGVFINGHAPYLQISNNRFVSNQGFYGGGVRVGWSRLINSTLTGYNSSFNENIAIHHNHFNQNGSMVDGGGIALYRGADNFAVTENYMCGNYCGFNGAAVAVFGLSPNGLIASNYLVFNQSFGEGGAVALVGEFVPNGAPLGYLTEGTGSMTIDSNLMQGNLAGDDGGAISIFSGSGQDVATSPDDQSAWYRFDIINNMIVNNIAAFSGAGISLADTVNVNIVHNTIANNDTASLAFVQQGNATQTVPQGAGIVARPNSPGLVAASGEPFSDPVLVNNVLWHNRAWYWDASANGGLGGLLADPVSPYWDLQVFGQGAGAAMDPRSCILSSTSDPRVPVVYDASNSSADPLFVSEYLNTLTVAPNIIAPSFSPRTLTGDYHICDGTGLCPGVSPAVDLGDNAILGAFGPELGIDYDADGRPSGASADVGADELVAAPGPDTVGPAVRLLSATPNPTMGTDPISVSAEAYDSFTGGSTIDAAEWWIGSPPLPGAGTPLTVPAGPGDAKIVSGSIPLPGSGNFNLFVRAHDAAGNWGTATSVFVRETGPGAGDSLPPVTTNLSATPNPTNGSASISITALAHDSFSGGSTIAQAEWWIGAAVPPLGSGFPMLAADGAFDSIEENMTANVAVGLSDFTVFVRSRDSAGNWGVPASVLVSVTPAGTGSGLGVHVQCPGDADGDAVIDAANDPHRGDPGAYSYPSDDRCMHISAGDGFAKMADGTRMYMFGFGDLTGIPPDLAISEGTLAATTPSPRIVLDEGDNFHLNLTNVAMAIRPDLFDGHSVHWHGFPEAAPIFDGVPGSSISIVMGSTLTYWYRLAEPGTYFYHCHVEATEHMQMGMIGNLYVRPRQNRLPDNYCFATSQVEAPGACAGHQHSNPDYNPDRNLDDPLIGDTYAYNDGDGSTRYDVEYPIQLTALDPDFHNASENVQPLPFALMDDTYPLINGRGYPDTLDPGVIWNLADDPKPAQRENAIVEARQEQRVLLRISDVNITRFDTLATVGIPMTVIGVDAKLLRGPSPDGGVTPGKNLYYTTNSVSMGGGTTFDVILDTTGVPTGTYPLYTTNLNYLSNDEEDFGGLMTEITITP